MLVPDTPIDGTLPTAMGSFLTTTEFILSYSHNLILFYWGETPDTLKANSLAVSFFPDKSDKDTAKTLTLRDGRVYADDMPLPKFGLESPDPDFTGSRWMPMAQPPKP